MSLSLLPTNAVLINQVAVTVYGVAPGATLQANFEAHAKDNGIDATLNLLLNSAGLGTDANFNAIVLANLGLASDAVSVAYMESSVAANGRLATMKAAFDFLGSVAGQDNVYGTAGTAFNSKVTKSIEYSSVATNTTASANAVSAQAVATGQTLTLTTSTDVKSGNDADDIFNSVLQDNGATGTTIQAGDAVNGGAGTDTLAIAVAGDVTNAGHTISAVQTTDVEKILVSNFDTNTNAAGITSVATDLMTGVTTVGLSASSATGDTTFTGMKTFVDAEMKNGSGDLTLTYNGAQVVTGTADAQNLTVSNVSAGTFTADGIETINVASLTSKSTVTEITTGAGANAELKKLVVTGDANLKLTNMVDFKAGTDGDTTIDATVDASAFTGALTMTADVNDLSFTGGSGDDVLDMAGTLTKFDVIDMGDGDDQVKINVHDAAGGALKLSDYSLTGVETFTVEATNNKNTSINADGTTVSIVDMIENNTDAKTFTVSNLANDSTIKLSSNVAGTNQAIGATSLTMKDASGEADVLNLIVAGTSGDGSTDGNDIVSITTSDVETINITSTKLGTTAFTTTDANVITSLVTGAATTKLTASGAEALQLTTDSTNTGMATIDASGMTGKFTGTFAHTADATITGGSSDDTINMGSTLTSADVIDLGAGTKDKVTATLGAVAAGSGAYQLSNVETFAVTHTTATTTNIDLASTTGLSTLSLVSSADGGTGTINVTNISGQTVVMADGNGFDGTLDVSLADATGAADAVTVNFKDETNGANGYDSTLKAAADIETFNITLEKFQSDGTTANTGDIDANISGVKSASIVVSGGGAGTDLDLTEGSSKMSSTTTSLDSTGFAGTLTATSSANVATTFNLGGDAVQTVTGSSAADSFTVAATTATHVLDGGAGTDTLTLNVKDGTTAVTGITNFETLNVVVASSAAAVLTAGAGKFYNDADAKTLNVSGGNSLSTISLGATDPIDSTSGITKADFSGFNGKIVDFKFDADQLADTVTIVGAASSKDKVSGVFDTAATYAPTISGVETVAVDLNAAAAVVFSLANVTAATSVLATSGENAVLKVDKITNERIDISELANNAAAKIEMVLADATGTDDVLNIKATAAVTAPNAELVAKNIETININADNALSVGLDEVTMDDPAGATAGSTKYSVNVTGDSVLTLAALHADLSVLDASANTGGLVISGGSSTATTITGSTVADTLLGGAAADVIIGGGGADSITGAAGADTLTGGDGADDFVIAKDESNALIFDTVTDFGTGDEIHMVGTVAADVAAAALGSKNSLASLATFNDYLNLGTDQDADGSAAGKKPIVEWFQYGGNTYITIDNTAATTFTAATDAIIQLDGEVDLKNTTVTLTAATNLIDIDFVSA